MSNIPLSSPLEKIQNHFYQEIINKRLILCPIENSQKNGKHTESHFWTLFYQIIWKIIIIHFDFVSFGLETRGPFGANQAKICQTMNYRALYNHNL